MRRRAPKYRLNPPTKPLPPDPLRAFVEQVARMEPYEPVSENEGYSGEQQEDAIDSMNSLIASARRLTAK